MKKPKVKKGSARPPRLTSYETGALLEGIRDQINLTKLCLEAKILISQQNIRAYLTEMKQDLMKRSPS